MSRVSNTVESSILAAPQWRSWLGASALLACAPAASQQGTAMSGAVTGTGLCSVATPAAAPRHRVEAAFALGHAAHGVKAAEVGVSVLAGVPAVTPMPDQLGQPTKPTSNQTHNYKYATGIGVNGVGASGPPRRRETA